MRRYEDTKKKEKNNENQGDLDDDTSNENDIRNDCRNKSNRPYDGGNPELYSHPL